MPEGHAAEILRCYVGRCLLAGVVLEGMERKFSGVVLWYNATNFYQEELLLRIVLEEAEGKLSELIGKVVFGGEEQVIITKRGAPVAKIVDYYADSYKKKLGVANA